MKEAKMPGFGGFEMPSQEEIQKKEEEDRRFIQESAIRAFSDEMRPTMKFTEKLEGAVQMLHESGKELSPECEEILEKFRNTDSVHSSRYEKYLGEIDTDLVTLSHFFKENGIELEEGREKKLENNRETNENMDFEEMYRKRRLADLELEVGLCASNLDIDENVIKYKAGLTATELYKIGATESSNADSFLGQAYLRASKIRDEYTDIKQMRNGMESISDLIHKSLEEKN